MSEHPQPDPQANVPQLSDDSCDSSSDTESLIEPNQPWKKFHAEPKMKPVDPTLSGLIRIRFEQCPISGGGG